MTPGLIARLFMLSGVIGTIGLLILYGSIIIFSPGVGHDPFAIITSTWPLAVAVTPGYLLQIGYFRIIRGKHPFVGSFYFWLLSTLYNVFLFSISFFSLVTSHDLWGSSSRFVALWTFLGIFLSARSWWVFRAGYKEFCVPLMSPPDISKGRPSESY